MVAEVARRKGEVLLKISGGSMLPALWPGDLVTVRRCNFKELQPGQVVLFSNNGRLTVHRVMSVVDDHLVARGDALPSADPPVKRPDLIGRVVKVQRGRKCMAVESRHWHKPLSWLLRGSGVSRRVTGALVKKLGSLGAVEQSR
jgi:signal peptidase I